MNDYQLTDTEIAQLMKTSINNVARLLPAGMVIQFCHASGTTDAEMKIDWPSGGGTIIRFLECTPMHTVMMVNTIDALLDDMEC